MVTRMGDWEIGVVSGRLPDNPGGLTCMYYGFELPKGTNTHSWFTEKVVNQWYITYDMTFCEIRELCSSGSTNYDSFELR